MNERKIMIRWKCSECGHTVLTFGEKPQALKWADGHNCSFVKMEDNGE